MIGEPYPVDVDADGDLDVLVASRTGSTGTVLLVRQISPGVFAPSIPAIALSRDLKEIRVTDVDLDGIQDVILLTLPAQGPLLLLDGLEDAGQIEVVREGPGSQGDLIWNSLSGPRIDVALASFTPSYMEVRPLVVLGKRAQRFAVGPLLSANGVDLVVQEGVGSPLDRAELVVYREQGNAYRRIEIVADDLSRLKSIGAHDLNSGGAVDILVSSERAPCLSWLRSRAEDFVTIRYCSPAVPNQTGRPASISASNGTLPWDQDFFLQAKELPAVTTTFFLASQSQDFQPVVLGFIGVLCIGGSIGRFVGPGQVQTSSADGSARLNVLRAEIPQPTGLVTAFSGSLWFFQAWYRDSQGGSPVSNFTDGLAVRFD